MTQRPWYEQTSSPTKRRVRRVVQYAVVAASVVFVIFTVLWALVHHPMLTIAAVLLVLFMHFVRWLLEDD